ncbi:MAG: diguanylate cyclase [Steroidobacteraceae bacterium]
MSIALAGVGVGLVGAGIAARYAIGFVSAAGASIVLARQARALTGSARAFALSASAGFAVYAVAAGIIVPPGPFWPSTVINQRAFVTVTGIPVQLLRGLLACGISLSIWGIWGQQVAAEVASTRYTAHVRKQFTWTLVTLATILVSGWTLTEHLGEIYRQNVQKEALSDIDLLASRLAGETTTIESMVEALAGSPSILPLVAAGTREQAVVGNSVLALNVRASGARQGWILGRSGNVIASSSPGATPPQELQAEWPLSLKSMAGHPDFRFVFDARGSGLGYYASYPIRAAEGSVVGIAVLSKSLDSFDAQMKQFGRPYFLVNPEGLIVMTNRPHALHRALWPLPPTQQSALAPLLAGLKKPALLQQAITDASWTNVDGERNYARRQFVSHSDWSLVILKPTREIFATRFLGIIITLLITIMALVYMLSRGRWIHDDVQLDKHLELQELAQDLGVKATTDALTGLHNRFRLEAALLSEMQRVDRYGSALSLLILDIDHFKSINDTHGHPAGDHVLVQLARFVPNRLRGTDLLARWGGEEFIILTPGLDGELAFEAAEKLRTAIATLRFADIGSVTCSLGVAQYVPGQTAAQLIARADAALYQAKAGGRNQSRLAPHVPGSMGLEAVA